MKVSGEECLQEPITDTVVRMLSINLVPSMAIEESSMRYRMSAVHPPL